MTRFRKVLVVGIVTVAVVLAGTAAYAFVARAGSVSDQQHFVHETNPFGTAAVAYVNVPGAGTSFTLTSPHLFDARFTAESRCLGAGGWCSVRIVVLLPSGAVIEMDPISGLDFAFDSAGTDFAEGHAIERTSQLFPAGSYRVQVQTAVVAGAASVILDDWTLAVEAVRP